MVRQKEVSQRTTPVSQPDGQVTITVTNNNLNNKLFSSDVIILFVDQIICTLHI